MTQGRSNSWRHSRCWSPNQRQGPGCRGHTLRRWPRRGVGGPHLRGAQDGPVSPARCEDCANLRWRAGRFRRHVAGDMPLSDSVAVVASRETDRPSPSCAAGCGAGDIGVCCLYSGEAHRRAFCIGIRRYTGQAHRGVRPSRIRIAAAADRGRYGTIFASQNCSEKQRGMRYQSILLTS